MKKLITALGLLFIILMLLCEPSARAQGATNFEVGVHLSMLRFQGSDYRSFFNKSIDPGVGARATFNINSFMGVEGEIDFYPKDATRLGNRTLALFGGKLGISTRNFGIYAKIRPGILRFSDSTLPGPLLPGACAGVNANSFVVDYGGIFEIYPVWRTVIRLDAGDVTGKTKFRCPLPPPAVEVRTHNLQFNIGVGFRF